MACKKCKSKRVASVTAKCSDACWINIGKYEYEGCAPEDMGITRGDEDYVEFSWCLDCGQIQGKFPKATTKIEKGEFEDDYDDDDD